MAPALERTLLSTLEVEMSEYEYGGDVKVPVGAVLLPSPKSLLVATAYPVSVSYKGLSTPEKTLFSTRSWAPTYEKTVQYLVIMYEGAQEAQEKLTITSIDTVVVVEEVVVEDVASTEAEGGCAGVQVVPAQGPKVLRSTVGERR